MSNKKNPEEIEVLSNKNLSLRMPMFSEVIIKKIDIPEFKSYADLNIFEENFKEEIIINYYEDLYVEVDSNYSLFYTKAFIKFNRKTILDCFYGIKLTNHIYPIIFENSSSLDPINVWYRSIEFFKQTFLNKKTDEINFILKNVIANSDAFYFCFRDLSFAYSREMLKSYPELDHIIKEVSNNISDNNKYVIDLCQLKVSPFPTKNKKLLRMFELVNINDTIKIFNEGIFLVHTVTNENTIVNAFILGYVDPQDLSFHNFENIINLNQYFMHPTLDKNLLLNFKEKNINENNKIGEKVINSDIKSNYSEHFTSILEDKEKIKIPEINTLYNGIFSFHLKLNDNVKQCIINIDKHNLYIPPFNSNQRGGKRFIFSSTLFSEALTESFRDVSNRILKNNDYLNFPVSRLANNLQSMAFVNYIFRYNKFYPGDKKFDFHYDTPYFSQHKKQISKYSLIIYLTSGKANPVIKFKLKNKFENTENKNDNNELDEISISEVDTNIGFFCVLFDHMYEHEGQPFLNSDKIFIRTEIVLSYCSNPEEFVRFNSQECKIFNIACYMTKQSLFNKELADYTNELFNHSTKSKLVMNKKFQNYKIIHKNYFGLNYLTNGDDYYFPNILSIKIHAIVVLLDYFNCKINNENFISNVFANAEKVPKININTNLNQFENNKDIDLNNETVFNKLVYCKILDDKVVSSFSDNDEILSYLNELQKSNLFRFDFKNAIEPFSLPFPYDYRSDLVVNNNQCCPRDFPEFYANGSKKVIDFVNNKNYEENNNMIGKSEITIFGKKVVIDFSNLIVEHNMVVFKKLNIPRVQFAMCEMESPPCWEGSHESEYTLEEYYDYTKLTCIPPIYYNKTERGFHLKIDIFNNNYIMTDQDTYIKTVVKSGLENTS